MTRSQHAACSERNLLGEARIRLRIRELLAELAGRVEKERLRSAHG